MIFKVYHKIDPTFMEAGVVDLDSLEPVAVVECEELGDVFRITNHIDHPWEENPEVVELIKRSRSTSVGDFVHDMSSDKWFEVASFGWNEIN